MVLLLEFGETNQSRSVDERLDFKDKGEIEHVE